MKQWDPGKRLKMQGMYQGPGPTGASLVLKYMKSLIVG